MLSDSNAPRVPGVLQGVTLLLPIILAVMGIALLVPVVPQLLQQFRSVPNHQYLVQGGVLTMPALCVALFSPVAGWLSDRFGRRRLLMTAMLSFSVVGVAPLMLSDLFAIVASRVGLGLCEAVVITVSTTLISDYFKGHARERWLAGQTAVASLASVVLIAVGGVLGAAYGWRGPFAVYSFSLVLALGVWRFTWEPSPEERRSTDETGFENSTARRIVEFPWARICGICMITLFASVMFFTVQTQSGVALNALGVQDPARVGTLTMIASLGVPLGTLIFRSLARIPAPALLCLEFLVIGAAFTAMGKAPSAGQFVAFAAINQVGCGMILPTLLTWTSRGLAFEVRGRGIGAWQSTFALGQFLSGVAVTFLGETVGGLRAALVVLGLASLVAAVLALAVHLRQWLTRQGISKTGRSHIPDGDSSYDK